MKTSIKTRIVRTLCLQVPLVVLSLLACRLHAADIPTLFNTGVDDNKNLLPGDSVDPHYKLITSADTNYPGPDAIVASQTPGYPAGPNSMWIAPRGGQSFAPGTAGNAPGDYAYQISFDLTGFNLSTVQITGQWECDSEGVDILINGLSTGNTIPTSPPPYGSFHPFTI